MTYNTFAVANETGRELALYEFRHGTTYYRFTTADRDIVYASNTYAAIPISDQGISQVGAADDGGGLKVTLPVEQAVAQLFRATPPSETVWLRVRRMQFGDSEAPVYWYGSVVSFIQKDEVTAELSCLNIGATLLRGGLRNCWTKTCGHVLFGPGCSRGLDKADFEIAATITAVDGLNFSAAAIGGQPSAWFDGGWVEWPVTGGVERRMITRTSGSQAEVLTTTDGLTVGLAVSLFPGCDLSAPTCDGKFNNIVNMGGAPNLVGRSPFDGNPVF
jgi:uncharacterized phage protein (TIGR02218 family)